MMFVNSFYEQLQTLTLSSLQYRNFLFKYILYMILALVHELMVFESLLLHTHTHKPCFYILS